MAVMVMLKRKSLHVTKYKACHEPRLAIGGSSHVTIRVHLIPDTYLIFRAITVICTLLDNEKL